MLTLRLRQASEGHSRYLVDIALAGEGLPRRQARVRFPFDVSAQEQEDLRWYLEDYLDYPFDPAPTIATRVEARMGELGEELFDALLYSSSDGRALARTLSGRLAETRIEVAIASGEHGWLPWEFLRDRRTGTTFATDALAFVRTRSGQTRRRQVSSSPPIRLLLVISRPGGRSDVPFRSVALQLLRSLDTRPDVDVRLEVLRPPTFAEFTSRLSAAVAEGRPYHVVHFDGHGTYEDLAANVSDEPATNMRGYLWFEGVGATGAQAVPGTLLGERLAEAQVPLLVLNACRSARAAPLAHPGRPLPDYRPQAFRSLAQEVLDAGVAGVVAMQYNIYVVTAAEFVADLYTALAQGQVLGEAATAGRRKLRDDPLREVLDRRPLQDWSVPIVYETQRIRLFPPRKAGRRSRTRKAEVIERRSVGPTLPPPPTTGFIGRDDALLDLERIFDTKGIVLLHALAGSGKSTIAAEFGRWYHATGGVDAVLYTSFERYRPPGRVVDELERLLSSELGQRGVPWFALSEGERLEEGLAILRQRRVLWIWDNVEPVAGFPMAVNSLWTPDEQTSLADFLRRAPARFLLTSRRTERPWLGDLVSRIPVTPMPMHDRIVLARALAGQQRRALETLAGWTSLLEFTEGNPLTIRIVVGQALREGLASSEDIEAFVMALRSGTADVRDEPRRGRSGSLSASLAYGFESAFSSHERAKLALLHLFQGFVDLAVLEWMGAPELGDLPALRDLTRAEGETLFNRAAEVGLLTQHQGGAYGIHPALPFYFKRLFDEHYAGSAAKSETAAGRATRAFARAVAALGPFYHHHYMEGNRDVINTLGYHEANLLHARKIARAHGWWDAVVNAMQGLRTLYEHTGRLAEWARLVDEIVPDFVDANTEEPRPGREEEAWHLVTQYRVQLARKRRDFVEAERLNRIRLERTRRLARFARKDSAGPLTEAQQDAIDWLASAVGELADILREQGNRECLELYSEAMDLYRRIGDPTGEAVVALNMGHASLEIVSPPDLDEAERWYSQGLALRDPHDRLGRAKGFGSLGFVALERFRAARRAGEPDDQLLELLRNATRLYTRQLRLLPADAVDELATVHNQLGVIYDNGDDAEQALSHFRKSLLYEESQGDAYGAAETRVNIAVVEAGRENFGDALLWAESALRVFDGLGERAAARFEETKDLIGDIEEVRASGG